MIMQLRLPIDKRYRLQPSGERPEPAFWIRRLRVVRELKPGDNVVVRDVVLRQGLNIIWAPPQQTDGGNALFKSGMAGHTAGKTTFCRLIRYALGERGLAAEGTRKRIREKFPSGWVLAEIVVGGQLWTVARPFGIGHHPFCIQGGDIEQATVGGDRLDYQLFLDALDGVTAGSLPATYFPASDEPVRWEHLLPWLSRDQECRFADFLEWRHSSSGSDAPALDVDERQFLVRSVLNLITEEERAEQKKNARLVSRRKEVAQKEPLLYHQAGVDHSRVERLLGTQLPFPPTGLFGLLARSELERRKADIEKRESDLILADRRAQLQEQLEKAIEFETNIRRDMEDTKVRLAAEKETLLLLTPRAQGEDQVSLLASLPPARGYCNVRMSVAREHGCPLATTHPLDVAERRCEHTAADELAMQQSIVNSLETALEESSSALVSAEAETRKARRTLMSAATSYDADRGQIFQDRAQLAQLERLILDAEGAWESAAKHSSAIKNLSTEIDASYVRQEQLRQEGRQSLRRFSDTFEYVVRAILGDEVQGRVESAGRSLSLVVEHHGERDSAALATVKLLAFDLAALSYSVEGNGAFPRFLVHDGPREADMAPEIYDRVFHYARQLEDSFGAVPSFQYIITTTTRPPDEFLNDRWLRLQLAGTPAAERFLRTDL